MPVSGGHGGVERDRRQPLDLQARVRRAARSNSPAVCNTVSARTRARAPAGLGSSHAESHQTRESPADLDRGRAGPPTPLPRTRCTPAARGGPSGKVEPPVWIRRTTSTGGSPTSGRDGVQRTAPARVAGHGSFRTRSDERKGGPGEFEYRAPAGRHRPGVPRPSSRRGRPTRGSGPSRRPCPPRAASVARWRGLVPAAGKGDSAVSTLRQEPPHGGSRS